eukprot:COSAG02_NODE_35387_length_469_cov_0.837838_1_plen_58_part_10
MVGIAIRSSALLLLLGGQADADAAGDTPNNTCTQTVGTKFNNTDYADGSGPRTAPNAS